jgi:hypothetical protein
VFGIPLVEEVQANQDFGVILVVIRRTRTDRQQQTRANISRQNTIDDAMVQHLFTQESFGVAGQIVVPRMLFFALRILEPLDGCIRPRRPNPGVEDDRFPGTIAPDENRQDKCELSALQRSRDARSLCAAYSLLGIDRCERKTDDPEANLSPMATSSTQ